MGSNARMPGQCCWTIQKKNLNHLSVVMNIDVLTTVVEKHHKIIRIIHR
jgi:hypothetical protein